MGKVMRFGTMYQDLMRFLRAEGLDEKIIEEEGHVGFRFRHQRNV